MQVIWLEQKYFKSLKTSDGASIEVLSPGIWNTEAGPDFLKAHVKIGEKELRGDIELHLVQDSWYQHQHHRDPRYDRVVLHICYWIPVKERPIFTSQEQQVTCAFLHPVLTIPESRLVNLIDLDLYPYKLFSGSGKCARLLFSKLPEENAAGLFQSAAFWRLQQKWQRLRAKIEDHTAIIAGGIATALGYKHNAEAFLALFTHFLHQQIGDETTLFSHLLKSCGFFDPHFYSKWSASSYYRALFSLQPVESMKVELKLDRIRPANHPVRRLAVLAKLMLDPSVKNLDAEILTRWQAHRERQDWKNLKRDLLALIPSYQSDYWIFHYTFEEKNQLYPISLIGGDLKQEILINVFLPFLYACIERKEELSAFAQFYASFSASKAKKGRYLEHRFFGETNKKRVLSKADTQQGAYQIHQDFCTHFEASCQGCPFVERYKNSIGGYLCTFNQL